MKTFTTLMLCATLLCGCALLDSLLGEKTVRATDEQGRPLYETADGATTLDATDPTGAPNKPKQIVLVNPDGAATAAEWLNKLGPWGALAGAMTTLAAGVYARVRNRQRLNEAGMRKQAESQLDLTGSALTFALRMIEKIKQGAAVDANRDGRVSLKEIQQWVREQGAKFEDPRFLAELVRIANATLPAAEVQRMLRAA